MALADFRHRAEAERALVQAVSLAERLRTDSPSEATYQEVAASTLCDLAEIVQAGAGRTSESLELLKRALVIRDRLVVRRPEDSKALAKLAATQVKLADLHRDLNSIGEAEAFYRTAIGHYSGLSTQHPRVTAYRFGHGQALCKMAGFMRERDRPTEGLTIARESIQRLSDVYNGNVRNSDYRSAISDAYWTLCASSCGAKTIERQHWSSGIT